MRRGDCYSRLSAAIGRQYHTADLRSDAETDLVIREVLQMRSDLGMITIG